jgi:hypothetical protein
VSASPRATGELSLHNSSTGDKYTFALRGVGEEPLAEQHVVIECVARQPLVHCFDVFNCQAAGDACELTVDSDLLHVSGVAIPRNHSTKVTS